MTGHADRNAFDSETISEVAVGSRGKLNVMGKRFGVEVLDVGEHGIRVSFPFADWPTEGMVVTLDLPSEQGYDRYRATVGYEPETAYIAGLILRDPTRCQPDVAQRGHCRVPTDLTVQVKESPHPRRFDASVLNLSIGGALLRSEITAAPGHDLAIDLSLPCHCVESIPAKVVYASAEQESPGERLFGVQFQNQKPETVSAISEYIDHRLKAMV